MNEKKITPHPDFADMLAAMIGEEIKDIAVGGTADHMLFQFHVGHKLLCFEIPRSGQEERGGRCLIIEEGNVDGAGIFPLEMSSLGASLKKE